MKIEYQQLSASTDRIEAFIARVRAEVLTLGFTEWERREYYQPIESKVKKPAHRPKAIGNHYDNFLQFREQRKQAA